jgi:queuine tRNA-ribosyltransferase
MKFELLGTDGAARRGRMTFVRGTVETPAFMPVGTYGTVKAMTPEELRDVGAEIVLGNTFHLMLRPGVDVIRAHGGLHRFMHWDGPILTDSGGFQVWSLGKLRKLTEKGVLFQSPVDGSRIFLGPEESMAVQRDLDSDIVMIFDECTAHPATEAEARASMELSLRWAERSKAAHGSRAAALFGIVQGGMYPHLRDISLTGLKQIGFDGYAIGGLSVGESKAEMFGVLDHIAPQMPADRPRYLMGVGTPEDLVEAARRGVDMFDCVLPTRNARNGCLFTSRGRILIKNAAYAEDGDPVDPDCSCQTCRRFSRAYLRHLFMAGEYLSAFYNTVHNLTFYLDMMRKIREAIELDNFGNWLEKIRKEDHDRVDS